MSRKPSPFPTRLWRFPGDSSIGRTAHTAGARRGETAEQAEKGAPGMTRQPSRASRSWRVCFGDLFDPREAAVPFGGELAAALAAGCRYQVLETKRVVRRRQRHVARMGLRPRGACAAVATPPSGRQLGRRTLMCRRWSPLAPLALRRRARPARAMRAGRHARGTRKRVDRQGRAMAPA
jgi:hypothetical protein